MKPISPQQRDVLAYLDFAAGPVAVYDLVGRGLSWHHAQRVCGSLARRGDAAVFVDGGGAPVRGHHRRRPHVARRRALRHPRGDRSMNDLTPAAVLRAQLVAIYKAFPVARASKEARAIVRDTARALVDIERCVACSGSGVGRVLFTVADPCVCRWCKGTGVVERSLGRQPVAEAPRA